MEERMYRSAHTHTYPHTKKEGRLSKRLSLQRRDSEALRYKVFLLCFEIPAARGTNDEGTVYARHYELQILSQSPRPPPSSPPFPWRLCVKHKNFDVYPTKKTRKKPILSQHRVEIKLRQTFSTSCIRTCDFVSPAEAGQRSKRAGLFLKILRGYSNDQENSDGPSRTVKLVQVHSTEQVGARWRAFASRRDAAKFSRL